MQYPRRRALLHIGALFAACLLLALGGAGATAGAPDATAGTHGVTAAPAADAGSGAGAAGLGVGDAPEPATAVRTDDATVHTDDAAVHADDATVQAGDAAAGQERGALLQDVDADRTHVAVDLAPDGDATWTLTLRVRLDDEASREAFESLQADVEADRENVTADFAEQMAGSVDAASEATDREMAVENVTVSTRLEGVPEEYGVLTYEFRWTNFAGVDGDALRAGDAIDGFFLEEGTQLTIRWPEGYAATSITPSPDSRTEHRATWRGGQTDFVTGEPRVVAEPASDRGWLWLAGGGAAIVVLLGGVAWLVASGRVALPGRGDASSGAGAGVSGGAIADASTGVNADASGASTDASGSASSGGATAGDATSGGATAADAAAGGVAGESNAPGDGSADATGAGDPAAGADGTAADASDGATAGSGDATATGSGGGVDDVPQELLSNEEQVLRLLEAEGGRLKQQQVVSELDWTEAKTSQVVTSMHDDGDIEKFRIGRENVLALPGEADL